MIYIYIYIYIYRKYISLQRTIRKKVLIIEQLKRSLC